MMDGEVPRYVSGTSPSLWAASSINDNISVLQYNIHRIVLVFYYAIHLLLA